MLKWGANSSKARNCHSEVRRKFGERHAAKKGFAATTFRTNLPSFDAGGVNLLFSSIYVPEKKLHDACLLADPAVVVLHARLGQGPA